MRRENSEIIIQQDREEMFTKMSFDKYITAMSPCSIDSSSSKISEKFNNIICEEINEYDEPITYSKENTISKKLPGTERKKTV